MSLATSISNIKNKNIDFKITKPSGKEILTVKDLVLEVDGKRILDKVNFTVLKPTFIK